MDPTQINFGSILVAAFSLIAATIALVFGIRQRSAREDEVEAERTRVLEAARALSARSDETRKRIEVRTAEAHEKAVATVREGEATRDLDPVDRANDLVRRVRGDSGK